MSTRKDTLDRLEVGIDRIAEAVERLNELARTVRMPMVTLRCASSPKVIWGEHEYWRKLDEMQTSEILEEIAEIERAKGNKNFPGKADDE